VEGEDTHVVVVFVEVVVHGYWHDFLEVGVVAFVEIDCKSRSGGMNSDIGSTGGTDRLYVYLLFFTVELGEGTFERAEDVGFCFNTALRLPEDPFMISPNPMKATPIVPEKDQISCFRHLILSVQIIG